jgi:hypothetical protein
MIQLWLRHIIKQLAIKKQKQRNQQLKINNCLEKINKQRI